MNTEQLKKIVRTPIFESRWFLIPFYYILVLGLVIYAVKFVEEAWHLVTHFQAASAEEVLITLLTLVDMVMMANLISMIPKGSYQNFVERLPDKTERISGGALKIKIVTSVVTLAIINMLPMFLLSKNLLEKIELVGVFMIVAIGLAFIEWIHAKSKLIESQVEKAEHEEEKAEAEAHKH